MKKINKTKTLALPVFVIMFYSCIQFVDIEKLKFFDPEFQIPDHTLLRVDGFYVVKETLITYLPPTDSLPKPYQKDISYGFIQFFHDGFCRIGDWNGIYRDSVDVAEKVIHSKTQNWRWGLYKLDNDTITIEYTRKWMESVFRTIYYRHQMVGVLKENGLIIINNPPEKYIVSPNPDDSSPGCVGTFVESEFDYDSLDNFVKKEPKKYLELQSL